MSGKSSRRKFISAAVGAGVVAAAAYGFYGYSRKQPVETQTPILTQSPTPTLSPTPTKPSPTHSTPTQPPTTPIAPTAIRGIVILVEFPDLQHDIRRSNIQDRFFNQLNDYVREMSYNKVSISGDVTEKWYKMPNPVSYYKISPRNLEVENTRLNSLINDVFEVVDRDIDFSKYSFTVLFLQAQQQEYGMIGLCAYPGMLGWRTTDILKTKSGQVVNGGVAIFCYQAHLGTLFHDIAHIVGGVRQGKRMVPCLYDHDLQAKPGPLDKTWVEAQINMGFWDPMSCHFYKRELDPMGISSWTRLRLNWVDQSKVKTATLGKTTEYILGPLVDERSEALTIKIPLTATTYYLIENRQPIGSDRYLPGSGILIMYADDSIAECRHGEAPVKLINADPGTPHLEGAAFDIGKKDSYIDERNRLEIQLLEKTGNSYKIRIST